MYFVDKRIVHCMYEKLCFALYFTLHFLLNMSFRSAIYFNGIYGYIAVNSTELETGIVGWLLLF